MTCNYSEGEQVRWGALLFFTYTTWASSPVDPGCSGLFKVPEYLRLHECRALRQRNIIQLDLRLRLRSQSATTPHIHAIIEPVVRPALKAAGEWIYFAHCLLQLAGIVPRHGASPDLGAATPRGLLCTPIGRFCFKQAGALAVDRTR